MPPGNDLSLEQTTIGLLERAAMNKMIYTMFAISCFVMTAQAQGQSVISLNFFRLSSGAGLMESSDVAGVVPVANWNTATEDNAHSELDGIDLVFDNGEESGAIATWQTGAASWSVGTAGDGSEGDKIMMTGYLDQNGSGLNQIHEVMVSDIPFEKYSVLLYHSSSGGANRTARYDANGIELFTRNLDPANTFDEFILDQHETLEDSNDSPTGGNYVEWSDLSGDLEIFAQGIGFDEGGHDLGGNVRRAPIQGIQIVEAILGGGGDYNGDGVVDAADADAQALAMKTPMENLDTYDENGDGVIDGEDRLIWVQDHAGTWVGDSDLDGEFNSGDLVVVFTAGKYETGQMAGWGEGDWDGNIFFDSSDLVAAFTDGGYEQGPLSLAAVPEPNGIGMIIIALVLTAVSSTRRRVQSF